MTVERWLPVPGYEGLYEVSDQGHVRSVPRHGTRGGALRPWLDRKGYAMVRLYRGARQKGLSTHRLVLLAFVGPPGPGQQCRHLDGDSSNNRLANLAWGTRSENARDRVRHGTHQEAAKAACPAGHAYYRDSQGWRRCRTCQREWQAAYRQRKRAAA